MSLACVCIFREPIAKKDPRKHDPNDPSTWQQGWEEMLDTVHEAARYLQDKADPALVAMECDDDGKMTGVVLRYRPDEVRWLEEIDEFREDLTGESTIVGNLVGNLAILELNRWNRRVADLVERSRLPPFIPPTAVRAMIEKDCVPPYSAMDRCALSPHPTLGVHPAGEAYRLVPQKGHCVRSVIVCGLCAEELAKHVFPDPEPSGVRLT